MECDWLEVMWTDHSKIFGEAIGNLRGKELYTDATLACEGRFFPVHKLVLSTCSQYFSAIFEWTPCLNPVVVINNITCKELEALLDFMYIGEVQVRDTLLPGVLRAAECLSIRGLVRLEEEKGKSQLSRKDESLWKRKSSHAAKNTTSSKSSESHVSPPTVPPQPKIQSNSTYTSYTAASVKPSTTKSTVSCCAESFVDQTLPNHSQNHTSYVHPTHTNQAVKLFPHHPTHTHTPHSIHSPQPPHMHTEQISQHQVQNTSHIESYTAVTSLCNHDQSRDRNSEPPVLHPEASVTEDIKVEVEMVDEDTKDLNIQACHPNDGTEIPELLNSLEHMRPLYDAKDTKDTEEIATLHAVEPSANLYDFSEGMPAIASSSNSEVQFLKPVQTASISFAKVEKRNTPEDPQDLTCQLCKRSYPRKESLTRHIQRVHKKDPYSCTICSFQTRIYRDFLLHKKMQHKVEKMHKCSLCDFTSRRFDVLRRHMISHSGAKVFRCDYCDFSSKRKQEVNRHVKNKHCEKQ